MKNERGAVIIQVAVCLLGLMAFSAFVIDHGIMMASRGQAQNAADAGALAGAISLAFESTTDLANARTKAQKFAQQNFVFGAAPDVLFTDINFLPPGTCKPPKYPGVPDTCIKVDVYRNQARANALPTYFANLVGINSQGVRATATAQMVTGDRTDCLKPWAVIDRWQEFGEPFGPTSTYDTYSDGKGQNPPQENDVYIAPGVDAANPNGTGFRLPEDEGRPFAIKTAGTSMSSGWFREILLPRADGHWTGGNVYNENIRTCGGLQYAIAQPGIACPATIGQDTAAEWAAKGCYGVKTGGTTGPTRDGIEYLTGLDTTAHYVMGEGIKDSQFSPPTASPRVVPIGALDPADYLSRFPTGSTGTVRLVNIYGYFIDGMGDVDPATGAMTLNPAGKAVIGHIIRIPGMGMGTSPIPATASFLNQVILVR